MFSHGRCASLSDAVSLLAITVPSLSVIELLGMSTMNCLVHSLIAIGCTKITDRGIKPFAKLPRLTRIVLVRFDFDLLDATARHLRLGWSATPLEVSAGIVRRIYHVT